MTGKSPCPRRKTLNLALIAFDPAFHDHPCNTCIYIIKWITQKLSSKRYNIIPPGWYFTLNIYTKTNTNSGMLNMAAVVGIFQQFVTNLGFFLVHSTSAPVCSLPTSPPPPKKKLLGSVHCLWYFAAWSWVIVGSPSSQTPQTLSNYAWCK